MNTARRLISVVLGILFVFILVGCGTPNERAEEAINTVPVPDKSNYFERAQIAEAETFKDTPNKIIFWYWTTFDGRLINSVACKGVPASSTESLEPDNMTTIGGHGWVIPYDQTQEGRTTEMMGLDGTFGNPVPFLYCMTVEGQYVQTQSPYNFVSSYPLTFPDPVTRVDEELEAKKLIAEKAIEDGKCVDNALNVVPCEGTP